jgi:hypothetical protein
VQDRYAGDVGDFLTLGLLRLLLDRSDLRLGVVWYRVPDETHNDDGKHTSYLDPGNAIGDRLRALDPDLHDRLGDVVRSGSRSVAALERSTALPTRTVTFDEVVDMRGRDAGERLDRRRSWVDRAVTAMDACDVVFADPDNGIRPSGHPTPRHRAKADKHAYLDELAPYTDRGQSLIIYQHADRTAPVDVQAARRLAEVDDELGVRPLAAVRASRGSCRLFLVLPAAAHRDHFAERLDALERSEWGRELAVYRSRLG